jgi:DnaK suppressor protein
VNKIAAKPLKNSRRASGPGRDAHYRRVLESKTEEVRSGLSARRSADVVHLAGEPLDFGDCCQKSHEEWLFLSQNQMESQLLRELEAALHRLDGGGFGICERCREPISAKRLEALPWARFCVACQEAPVSAGCEAD